MRSLETIQKTFRIFEILTKVARILCIVGACLCAGFALCIVIQYNGGRVLDLFGRPLQLAPAGEDLRRLFARLLSYTIVLCGQILLLALAGRYFRAERAAGTPFTAAGAEQLRRLGIRCIYVPIVALVVAAVVIELLDAGHVADSISDNLPSLSVGLLLLLVSVIFRYGAELEQHAGIHAPAESGTNLS